jgi:hypothetical protein
MNPALITAIATGAVSIITAATALIRVIRHANSSAGAAHQDSGT